MNPPSDPLATDRFHYAPEVVVRHHPQYGAAFHHWLECQLEGFARPADRAVALDVGAHEGEFFQSFLAADLVSSVVLFEPNPTNAECLRRKFQGARVTIEEMAVAAQCGSADFGYGDDTATGSLLKPVGWTPTATLNTRVVVTTLDDYATRHGLLDRVNVLKIDTQGSDLQVLIGAEGLLAASQPVIIVEMIYAPLYENQGDPAELLLWLTRRGYRLAGLFDEHYSREGWLAWCDACFLPVSRMSPDLPPFMIRQSLPAATEPANSDPAAGRSDARASTPDTQRKSRLQKWMARLSNSHD